MFKCFISSIKLKNIMILVLSSLLFVSINSYARFEQLNSCVVPQNLKPWDYYATKHIRSAKDWKNNTTTDYWQLVYSWSPNYCHSLGKSADRVYQCREDFGLIVHGLWAQSVDAKNYKQHPRNCSDKPALDIKILRKNFCLMPSAELMQKQWEKHGSCDFEKAEDYFVHIQQLDEQLTLPSKAILDKLQTEKEALLRSWLLKNNKAIALKAEHIKIQKSGRYLREISFCYDLNFKLRSCNSKAKTNFKRNTTKQNNYKSESSAAAQTEKSWKDRLLEWFQ